MGDGGSRTGMKGNMQSFSSDSASMRCLDQSGFARPDITDLAGWLPWQQSFVTREGDDL